MNIPEKLYLLPFDHRHSYVSKLFHCEPPLDAAQHARVVASKQVVYAGFKLALEAGLGEDCAGLLVDEEFGADILRDAVRRGRITAIPTEKSGQEEFEFEYGDDFARHLDTFDPTYAKALVRYNPEGDAALNRRQAQRLRQLSDYCRRARRLFMFELLVPPTPAQLERAGGDKNRYDADIRPQLMLQVLAALQDAGVEPDVWKIEGLDRRGDCERIAAAARRGGRDAVNCIVLGRGADAEKVSVWLRTAAGVPGFIGFAVGRTTFWDALVDYVAGSATREQAAARIAVRYRGWVETFEGAAARA